jgi:hypothetical protein
MDVPINETRQGDHAAAIDLDRRPTANISSNRNDLAIVQKQITRIDYSCRGIHRNDGCAFDSDSR